MNVGAGDIITLGALAFKCYRVCKDSSEQFSQIAREVSNLHTVLLEVKEALEEYQPLSPTRQERVNIRVRDCEECLKDLDALLTKYQSMYTADKRIHDRLKWSLENVAELRTKIVYHTTTLDVLTQKITNESFKRIEQLLRKLCAEHRAGRRQGSTMSSLSDHSSDVILTDWDQVKREVEDIGIPPSVIDEQRVFIQNWLKTAMEAGDLDEDPELVHSGRGRKKQLAPSSSGFRSSQATVVDETDEQTTTYGSDMVDPLSRLNINNEPPSRDSMEAGPSISRQGTGLFDPKWQETLDKASEAGENFELPISLVPSTPRRKSSGLNSALNKLLYSNQRIIKAASDGDAVEVSRLLGLGIDVNTKDQWKWTAMSMAAYGGHEEVARVLMANGATLDHKDVDDDTPYDLAMRQGHRNLVMMIEEETTQRAVREADKPEARTEQRKGSLASLRKWRTR